jgi:hypothetical protein
MNDGYKTQDIFFAAVLGYLEYPLLTVELLDERSTLWGFDCASCDADILRQQYDGGELALSSTKSFVNAYNILARQQRDLRRTGQMAWCSPAWISGRGR